MTKRAATSAKMRLRRDGSVNVIPLAELAVIVGEPEKVLTRWASVGIGGVFLDVRCIRDNGRFVSSVAAVNRFRAAIERR
jgi:hypothetical protein